MDDLLTPSAALVGLLRQPHAAPKLSLAQWDLVVRQARSAALLGRLWSILTDADALGEVPEQPRRHLEWAATVARKHAQDVAWEVAHVRHALAGASVPVILLKGAAYLMAGLPPARGRVFADLDILVPARALPQVEKALTVGGWINDPMSQYDDRYYRTWMHELPPMRHAVRGTVIDVHHTILPRTAQPRIDADALIASAQPISEGGLCALAPEDMTLHMAVHTFYDGELTQGLRDLLDLDSLLRHFSRQSGFWDRLFRRAEQFGLSRPLWYALNYANAVFETPVPEEALGGRAAGAPPWLVRRSMDAVVGRALRPMHPSCDGWDVGASRLALYVRSHYLRMPLKLLLPHLARKAAMGFMPAKKRPA